MKKSVSLTVGELAKAAGVHVETVRYYQRCGLLATPERRYGTIRRYADADRDRLRFIRRVQRPGFALEEAPVCSPWTPSAIGSARPGRNDLDARIADRRAMRRVLVERIAHCVHGRFAEPWPILDAFRGDVGAEPLEKG